MSQLLDNKQHYVYSIDVLIDWLCLFSPSHHVAEYETKDALHAEQQYWQFWLTSLLVYQYIIIHNILV